MNVVVLAVHSAEDCPDLRCDDDQVLKIRELEEEEVIWKRGEVRTSQLL